MNDQINSTEVYGWCTSQLVRGEQTVFNTCQKRALPIILPERDWHWTWPDAEQAVCNRTCFFAPFHFFEGGGVCCSSLIMSVCMSASIDMIVEPAVGLSIHVSIFPYCLFVCWIPVSKYVSVYLCPCVCSKVINLSNSSGLRRIKLPFWAF